MKKFLSVLILLVVGASAFAWENWAEYELFCYQNGIEPSYEEYEYYAENGGCCYITEDAEAELERIMALANN